MSSEPRRRPRSGDPCPPAIRLTDLGAAGRDAGQEPSPDTVRAPETPDPDSPAHSGELLLAYLYLRRDAGGHTRAVLEGHMRSFARREGYDLLRVLVATEESLAPSGRNAPRGNRIDRTSDPSVKGTRGAKATAGSRSLRDLVELIEVTCARKVLVVGPAREALVLLHRMNGIQVLTLAHVRPLHLGRHEVHPDPGDGHGRAR
jgi:hypothetical protein